MEKKSIVNLFNKKVSQKKDPADLRDAVMDEIDNEFEMMENMPELKELREVYPLFLSETNNSLKGKVFNTFKKFGL